MHDQLVEVNDDCSFQAAFSHEGQEPIECRAVNRFLKPVMKVMCYDEPDKPREFGRRASPHAR